MSGTDIEYKLGSEVQHRGTYYRVIRIITRSQTLFEAEVAEGSPDNLDPYVQTESYVELKGPDGSIDFVVLMQEKELYLGPLSSIKATEPIHWDITRQWGRRKGGFLR